MDPEMALVCCWAKIPELLENPKEEQPSGQPVSGLTVRTKNLLNTKQATHLLHSVIFQWPQFKRHTRTLLKQKFYFHFTPTLNMDLC
jgi:hypothetical protein